MGRDTRHVSRADGATLSPVAARRERVWRRTLVAVALLLVSPWATSMAAADRVYLTVDQALANAFPKDVQVTRKVVWITADQAAEIERRAGSPLPRRVVQAYEGKRGEDVVGYAFVDDVIGKTEPITYMVTITPDTTVERLDLLVFRETHGYEIERSSWRDRFRGERLGNDLRVGRDIDKITGATLSCRAVTDGVRRLLAVVEVVLNGGAG
jgi:Na+-translocating ferredoxin:NAD+ oxidoreductase RnfG subunit